MHGRSGGYDSMIDFFEKTKGSISLFLALIMLPMMTVAGLIVDGARISAAKASLSGAGDLAMNAALSEYDQILYDVYGIFAVSENMEELRTTSPDILPTPSTTPGSSTTATPIHESLSTASSPPFPGMKWSSTTSLT